MPERRSALVTGASRGIGRAIALKLARVGVSPIVVHYGSREEQAREVCAAVEAEGGRAIPLGADLGEPGQAAALARDALQHCDGRVDILVNNAGMRRDGLFAMMSEEAMRTVLEVNLVAPMVLARQLVREMLKARWGRIVNIASGAAITGNAGQTNYAASKGGLISFTKSLALELGNYGVLVNAVAPGLIETDMVEGLKPEAREAILAKVPLRRIGSAEDVAALVGFLCGDDAGYLTGQVLQVNGGLIT